jgi:HD-GYP domain-containing protein (c-di-GMP phosphodiesterase class II)
MSDPIRFLRSFSQALSTLALYGPSHPVTARAMDGAYRELTDLQASSATLDFTFLPGEVLFGRELLQDLETWEWTPRLIQAGIERLEVTGPVAPDHFARFLGQAAAALGMDSSASTDVWQDGPATIRFGRVRVRGAEQPVPELTQLATVAYSLRDERETVGWLHQEALDGRVPTLEAYGVVQSLSLAMRGGQAMMLPLLELKEFDQYTTTHAINVAVLAMGVTEFLGMGPAQVRGFGLAGLLHDLGKVKIPKEILTKPGKLTPEERKIVEAHPADGAKLILEGEEALDLAATVAYEHHLHADGHGYPHLHYPREAHQASRLVHVCDVYDALRTKRPYRDAWASAAALEYIRGRSGSEFDPAAVHAFSEMMQTWDSRIALQSA